jgi:hypothetical protein
MGVVVLDGAAADGGLDSGDRPARPATIAVASSHHQGPLDVELAAGVGLAGGVAAGVAVGAAIAGAALGGAVAGGAVAGGAVAGSAVAGGAVAGGAVAGGGVAGGAVAGGVVAGASGGEAVAAGAVAAGTVGRGRPAPGLPEGTGSDSDGRGLTPAPGAEPGVHAAIVRPSTAAAHSDARSGGSLHGCSPAGGPM